MKINLPIFKGEDAKDAITYHSWEVGLDGIPLCGMQRLHPPSVCHLVLARVPQRTSVKFGDGYTHRQHAYHTR